jgi:hypothetical protein
MTVHGMQQHEQSSVLMHEHLPPCGLTTEPAAVEIDDLVEAGIVCRCDEFEADVNVRLGWVALKWMWSRDEV